MLIAQCKGNGQGSCKRCYENGRPYVNWCGWLYKIDGMIGSYCTDCVRDIAEELHEDIVEVWEVKIE